AMTLMGARCSPDNRACFAGSGPISCAQNQVPACISWCAAAGTAGQACALDPCDPNAIGGTVAVCDEGLSCVANTLGSGALDPRLGTCQVLGTIPLAPCNPAGTVRDSNPCATGTYCRQFENTGAGACAGAKRPTGSRWATATAMCIPFAREGELCD